MLILVWLFPFTDCPASILAAQLIANLRQAGLIRSERVAKVRVAFWPLFLARLPDSPFLDLSRAGHASDRPGALRTPSELGLRGQPAVRRAAPHQLPSPHAHLQLWDWADP